MQDSLFVATRDQTARIAGITRRQLDYWSATGLVRPQIDTRLSPGRRIALYDFTEVMAVMVVATVRSKDSVPLQEVRRVVDHVRKSLLLSRPLNEVRFAVCHRKLFFQLPDGTWESDRQPGQKVLSEAMDLKAIRLRISRSAERRAADIGRIERRRGTMGSKPVVAGTRIPVATVQAYLVANRSVEEIIQAYPALRAEDIEAVRATSAA